MVGSGLPSSMFRYERHSTSKIRLKPRSISFPKDININDDERVKMEEF